MSGPAMNDSVLIVDDSLTVRMDLQEAFDNAGFETRACGTAAAARASFASEPVDVIVLDVLLPDGDGVELLRELRASPVLSGAVVMMLSTEAEVKDRVRGLSTGADEYVGKPYDAHYVVARARELLRARRESQGNGRSTILVIDDSITFREALRQVLEESGYAVRVVGSGEEGLRAAAVERPAAVVVDSQLPGLDGAGVIRRLRLDTALRGMPCLLLTGSEDRDAELRAFEAGADAFARKDEGVDLILARLAAVLRSAATPPVDQIASLLGPKRILAVDDSPTYLADLSATLRDEGYDVVAARSGEQALELLALQPMDCILLDLVMPGLGGHETCRRIKTAPVLRDIPLIILTSIADRSAMLDALEAGADDYIHKSSEFEVVKARVRAQLRRKQFEDDRRRMRGEQHAVELEAAEARAARALADSRAELLAVLEQKNEALESANTELQTSQLAIAQTNRELASANQAKTEFLSTMSHELRTPLNAIIGFSEILRDGIAGPLSTRQHEFAGHICDSGKHLLALINDILDLSKIEAGKAEIDLEPVDIDGMLGDALEIVRDRANGRSVRLEMIRTGRTDPLRVDRRRLKQIAYNLLSNAVKFTPAGGEVCLRARQVDRQQAANALPGFARGRRMPLPDNEFQRFVEISVSDSGIGISAADLDKLFMPFTQIRNAVAPPTEGTGLGLVTVARLAQMHGGTVAVTSQPGLGSWFTVWLPWRGDDTVEDEVLDAPLIDAHDRPLALVVEDDSKAADLIRIQLEAAGFRVRRAASAEAALALVPECTPDLITLDIQLPGMDGWDFMACIKEHPTWTDIPVVVVSVAADHEVGLSLGAAAVMQKPIGRTDFACELQKIGFTPAPDREVKVLVVDDDPGTVDLMSAYLSQPGYTVLHAFGGKEGIEQAQRHLPDVVVLDLLMPDVSGIDVVEALKRDEATASIPVIVVAAREFSTDDREQLNRHVLAVVDKDGLARERFLGEVRRAFGRTPRR